MFYCFSFSRFFNKALIETNINIRNELNLVILSIFPVFKQNKVQLPVTVIHKSKVSVYTDCDSSPYALYSLRGRMTI